ncbi:MAG TPA: phytoene/squalene synthase family protein [Nitrospiria bacterium]|nr:phytoene/squalene synthase family protein [Nitrospiria bacterium]
MNTSKDAVTATLLRDILRSVSRSFYLTLRVAPPATRRTLGLAYLFCRAADTIADTGLLPRTERLTQLGLYREQFLQPAIQWDRLFALGARLNPDGGSPGERALLTRLGDCFHLLLTLPQPEQRLIRALVCTLTNGMAMDLTSFPGDDAATARALPTIKETDQYCYFVAGCVGEFWTRLHRLHIPAMAAVPEEEQCRLAVEFGKGLQMTNLLKDLAVDLARGRCYIPADQLAAAGLSPADLAKPGALPALRPIVHRLIKLTIDHLDHGWRYIEGLPRRPFRLRLACLWPHLLALKTLALVAATGRLLEPAPLKISRAAVYRTMAVTMLVIWSPQLLNRYHSRLRRRLMRLLGD